jgi:RIO kinase 1
MDTKNYLNMLDEFDDLDRTGELLDRSARKTKYPPRSPHRMPKDTREFVARQDDTSRNFKFTYTAARFEEWWLLESLGAFYEHGWISDVLSRVKGCKEASVYLCQAGPQANVPLLAAKVYRPRQLRNLKNDAQYRVGRADLDADGNRIVEDGMLKALHRRTNYGEQLRHQSWIVYEFQTLRTLREAGADVPAPHAVEHNAILMDYIGGAQAPAPGLHSVRLGEAEAHALWERTLRNIDLMLAHGCIHGDLSAYNILYWQGDITLIDFPQVVSPDRNPRAWEIFLRDVTRMCQYFETQGIRSVPGNVAASIWARHHA